MSVLPRTIPAAALELMTDSLAAVGVELGPVKAGTRVTRTVEHDGASWELTFCGPFWCLRGPGVEHGVGVFEYEAAERITARPATPAPSARPVHVRIGSHRTAYHPDAACPALNGKPETYRGQELMPEHEAQERGLTLCGACETEESTVPETYAGVSVPALVRAAWAAPLGEGWRLGVRSSLAARA